ncbi:MAG: hypothetical protein GY790_18380 [Bacteroidetes bacterium]|nr:hypothetical protein [Bacteroidota bacterium]
MINDINRTIHETARQLLLIFLYSTEEVGFTFLKRETGMTQGKLPHISTIWSRKGMHLYFSDLMRLVK